MCIVLYLMFLIGATTLKSLISVLHNLNLIANLDRPQSTIVVFIDFDLFFKFVLVSGFFMIKWFDFVNEKNPKLSFDKYSSFILCLNLDMPLKKTDNNIMNFVVFFQVASLFSIRVNK